MDRERDPNNQWDWLNPMTPEELAEYRKQQIEWARKLIVFGSTPEFTCDNCVHANKCTLAFNAYNTDGDCLWEK